jgi:hypothetical protein
MKQVLPPHITSVSNERLYDALYYTTTELPLLIMEKIAKSPYFGNQRQLEKVKNF